MKGSFSKRRLVFTSVLCLFLGVMAGTDVNAETLRIGGTGSARGVMKMLAKEFQKANPDVRFEFPPSLGSHGGIKALEAGVLDLATAARPLKAEAAEARIDVLPFARTALAMVTSREDFIGDITRENLVQVFSFRRTSWLDGVRIRPILRHAFDIDTKTLVREIPELTGALDVAFGLGSIPVANNDQHNLDLAERLPGTLAISSLSAVVTEKRDVSVLSFDGVPPTLENLASGDYPLSKTLYLAVGPKSPPMARVFADFVRDTARDNLLRRYGCIPVT